MQSILARLLGVATVFFAAAAVQSFAMTAQNAPGPAPGPNNYACFIGNCMTVTLKCIIQGDPPLCSYCRNIPPNPPGNNWCGEALNQNCVFGNLIQCSKQTMVGGVCTNGTCGGGAPILVPCFMRDSVCSL